MRTDETVTTCPACSAPLEPRGCRLVCAREGCGYYASCSDFY